MDDTEEGERTYPNFVYRGEPGPGQTVTLRLLSVPSKEVELSYLDEGWYADPDQARRATQLGPSPLVSIERNEEQQRREREAARDQREERLAEALTNAVNRLAESQTQAVSTSAETFEVSATPAPPVSSGTVKWRKAKHKSCCVGQGITKGEFAARVNIDASAIRAIIREDFSSGKYSEDQKRKLVDALGVSIAEWDLVR